MREIRATEAKAHLAELLRAVEHGETVAITRHGRAIAHLTPAQGQDHVSRRLAVERFRSHRRQWRRIEMTTEEIIASIHEGRRG
jgi:prevent-host-death family protein